MSEPSQRLLVMWCNTGLECCVNITTIDKEIMWATLKGEDKMPTLPNLNMLIMRARYNSQRHYEIYTVDVDESITAADIEELFDTDAQRIVDLIRARGHQLYSDRVDTARAYIV